MRTTGWGAEREAERVKMRLVVERAMKAMEESTKALEKALESRLSRVCISLTHCVCG